MDVILKVPVSVVNADQAFDCGRCLDLVCESRLPLAPQLLLPPQLFCDARGFPHQ